MHTCYSLRGYYDVNECGDAATLLEAEERKMRCDLVANEFAKRRKVYFLNEPMVLI